MKVVLHALLAALLLVPGALAVGLAPVTQEDDSGSIATPAGPLGPDPEPWRSLTQAHSGEAGEWVVVYQRIAPEHLAEGTLLLDVDYTFDATDPDGEPVAVFAYPPQVITRLKGGQFAIGDGHLQIEDDGTYHREAPQSFVGTSVSETDPRTHEAGMFFLFAASAPWTVSYTFTIANVEGDARTVPSHQEAGDGMLWARETPEPTVDPLGGTSTYDKTFRIGSGQGWRHVEIMDPADYRFGTGDDPEGAQAYHIDFGSRSCEGAGLSIPGPIPTWVGRISHCGYPFDDGGQVSAKVVYDEPRPGLEMAIAHFPGMGAALPPVWDEEYPRDFPVGTAVHAARSAAD